VRVSRPSALPSVRRRQRTTALGDQEASDDYTRECQVPAAGRRKLLRSRRTWDREDHLAMSHLMLPLRADAIDSRASAVSDAILRMTCQQPNVAISAARAFMGLAITPLLLLSRRMRERAGAREDSRTSSEPCVYSMGTETPPHRAEAVVRVLRVPCCSDPAAYASRSRYCARRCRRTS
jgi:hypothetical protein